MLRLHSANVCSCMPSHQRYVHRCIPVVWVGGVVDRVLWILRPVCCAAALLLPSFDEFIVPAFHVTVALEA